MIASFLKDKIVMDGLTYDDVLLIPAYSEVLPRTVSLDTKFSRNIDLKIPFVTAAMDTVTEAEMAIAIAREGGIGVIHKNMSIEDQARQVAIVKRAENGMIYDPVTIQRGKTVRDALAIMAEYHIGGIPVVDDNMKLVGIVTNRDLRFETDQDKFIDEVMTSENLVTTTTATNLSEAAEILQQNKIEKLPVVDAEGKLVGLITYKDITKAKDKPMACKDAKGRYYTYPDDWTDSFYGVRDALSNLLTYGSNGNQVTAKDRAAAKASYAALQQEIMADYADMKAAVAAADTLEAKQAAATNASNAMSQKVYNTTLKMYNKLQAKTAARAWVSSLLH